MDGAWAFYRRSTAQQELSIDDQRKKCVEYAAELNCVIRKEFVPAKGYASGLSIEYDAAFQEMVRLAETTEHGIKYLIIHDVSRMGRMEAPVKTFWEVRFSRVGIKIVSATERLSLTGSSSDNFYRFMLHDKAHDYSQRLREDTIRGCKSHAALGRSCGGSAPYGYDRLLVNSEGKAVQVLKGGERKAQKTEHIVWTPGDFAKQETVLWMFRSKDSGNGIKSIANALNRQKIPSPRGRSWGKISVREILRNEAYVGTRIYFKNDYHDRSRGPVVRHRLRKEEEWTVKENAHPPLVSQELFDRVQATFREYKPRDGRSADSPHLLSGLIYCERCGHRYCGQYHHHKGTKTRYYDCGGYNGKGTEVCQSFGIKADLLDAFALDEVAKKVKSPPSRDAIKSKIIAILQSMKGGGAEQRVQELSAAVAGVDANIRNLIAALAQRPASAALLESLDAAETEKSRLLTDLSGARAQLPDESYDVDAEADAMLANLARLPELLAGSSTAERRTVVRTYIHHVDIRAEELEARFSFFSLPGLRTKFGDHAGMGEGPQQAFSPTEAGKSFAGPRGPANVPNQTGCGGWI